IANTVGCLLFPIPIYISVRSTVVTFQAQSVHKLSGKNGIKTSVVRPLLNCDCKYFWMSTICNPNLYQCRFDFGNFSSSFSISTFWKEWHKNKCCKATFKL